MAVAVHNPTVQMTTPFFFRKSRFWKDNSATSNNATESHLSEFQVDNTSLMNPSSPPTHHVTFNRAKKHRFSLKRFSRSQKAPPVPSLPPTLDLDFHAGRVTARTAKGQVGQGGYLEMPSAAAALAAQAQSTFTSAQPIPKPDGEQRKKRLDAMANARLDVEQARDLLRLCGKPIRERGLDTLGLFRPFRVTEMPERIEYMIQLFLVAKNPTAYASVFPILPENVLDRLSTQPADVIEKAKAALDELEKELRYASPHDIVALLKWGLRHMKLRPIDFHSPDAYSWYQSFVQAEQASNYSPSAVTDFFYAQLPQPTAEFFSDMLDLMASVAAHHPANLMSASFLCKILGFWLVGRIGVAHPPPTFDLLLETADRSSAMVEHLLLAHIRSQAAVAFTMPLRLIELIEGYPHLGSDSSTPSIPPAFTTRQVPVIRVDLRSENLIVSPAKPRSPLATLTSAVDATTTSDTPGDDTWSTIVSQLKDKAVNGKRGTELLMDEHARILQIVDQEFEAISKLTQQSQLPKHVGTAAKDLESSVIGSPQLSSLSCSSSSTSITTTTSTSTSLRRRSRSLGTSTQPSKPLLKEDQLRPSSKSAATLGKRGSARVTDRKKLDPLSPSDWKSFSEAGFTNPTNETEINLDLTLRELKISPPSRTRTLPTRRNKNLAQPFPPTNNPCTLPTPPQPNSKITNISMTSFSPTLATLWQDQLLDSALCCCFPTRLVFVQLSKQMSWLLIVETILPPLPPLPIKNSVSVDRKSLFAPSLRSVRRVSSNLIHRSRRKHETEMIDFLDQTTTTTPLVPPIPHQFQSIIPSSSSPAAY